MKRRNISIICLLFVCVFSFLLLSSIQTLNKIETDFMVNYEDIENANKNHIFGSFVNIDLKEKDKSVDGQMSKNGEIVFKLFGLIPVKKINVEILPSDDYYVGGNPIGISIYSNGGIVVSGNEKFNCNIKQGDIITEIEGVKINSIEELENMVIDSDKGELEAKILRKNKEHKTILKKKIDERDGKLKLGIVVKDDVAGIGTLTFVNKSNMEYSAVGHPIVDSHSGNIIPVAKGDLCECNLIGINKSKRNEPGELRCVLMNSNDLKGTIDKNSKFGISGILYDKNGFVDENVTAKIGGRLSITPGKAKLISSISGIREEYDIEIIKANYQKTAKDKSMIFRVVDKRLLNLTGGIVQGMSGSPIVQNGKIVGAVTHVFMNDPTKGFAVYADWLIQ